MKIIILALCASFILVEVVGWHLKIKKWLKITGRIKPLDCFACLSFWISIVLLFVPTKFINLALIPAVTAIIGQALGKIITDWKLK